MMPWDEGEAEQVRGLLTQFNDAAEVCAVMGCDIADLDTLCIGAFGMSFELSKKTFAAQGRAMLRRSLMQQALEGNMKALDMLSREQLGMGAVEIRHSNAQSQMKEDTGAGTGKLSVLQGKRKDRRTRAVS